MSRNEIIKSYSEQDQAIHKELSYPAEHRKFSEMEKYELEDQSWIQNTKCNCYFVLDLIVDPLRVEPKVTFNKYLGYSKNSSGRSDPKSLYVIRVLVNRKSD